VLGGVVFAFWILRDSSHHPENEIVWRPCCRLLCWSAAALALVEFCWVAADSAILSSTAGLRFSEITGAAFFVAGVTGGCSAALIAAATVHPTRRPMPLLWVPAVISLSALVATSHAAGRIEDQFILLALTALHHASTAVWIGGLAYLAVSLAHFAPAAPLLCRRFSRMAMVGAGVLMASGLGMSLKYVGSRAAVYGTSYGAMVASKAALFLLILLVGSFNFLIVRQHTGKLTHLLGYLQRFAEAEIGLGFTVILAAASLTSQPPAIDLIQGRVTGAEIWQRLYPVWPRLQTPPLGALSPATPLRFSGIAGPNSFTPGTSYRPSSPADIAWSEYNHHWAGLIVLAIGLLAVLSASGLAPWARHWPLVFLGLAVFLFLRADPENWPLGPRSFWQSFAVAEVMQHRLFVLLIVAFAVFEWGVRNARIAAPAAALVFPAVCAAGGALLLTHTHSLANVKEELLAELSHIPLAIFAVIAGWSRWLELRLPQARQRIPACIWPVCFILIGAVLLNYREG
jgi:putative copper resistance protein D